ncbi:hypothetical protein [Flavobacterium sp.]|jgi:hypothetical protein|uniref:hypothetical protein n=1 Tax=Flavobacterium sp. TaxID=239 RepID=UPI00350B1814
MSERWKYQLKSGGLWGLFMSVFILLFNMKEQPIAEQLQHPEFWVKTLVYLIVGIFGLGYYNWKHKQKQQSK